MHQYYLVLENAYLRVGSAGTRISAKRTLHDCQLHARADLEENAVRTSSFFRGKRVSAPPFSRRAPDEGAEDSSGFISMRQLAVERSPLRSGLAPSRCVRHSTQNFAGKSAPEWPVAFLPNAPQSQPRPV